MPNRTAIIILLSLISLLVPRGVFALTSSPYPIKLNAKSYGLEQGLSQIAVSSITEDHDGYVWAGTLNGLNKYNGQKFRHYFAEDGSELPSSFIRRLFTDSKGRVFIGTDNGLVIYDSTRDKFYTPGKISHLNNQSISSISEVSDKILISTTSSVYVLDDAFNTIDEIYSNQSIEIKDVKKIGSYIYVLTYDTKLIISSPATPQTLDNIKDIAVLTDLLIATRNNDTLLISGLERIELDINLDYLSQTTVDNNLVGINNNKLYRIFPDTSVEYLGSLPIQSTDISSIKTIDSTTYITTFNRGYYATSDKMNILADSELFDSYIWDIKRTDGGNILISDGSEKLFVLNDNLQITDTIHLGFDGHKKLWIVGNYIYLSSQQGLFEVDLQHSTCKLVLEGNYWSITGDDHTIYLGSDNGTITTLDLSTGISRVHTIDPNGFPIFDLLVTDTPDNTLWIATQGGLYTFDDNKTSTVLSKFVTSLYEQGNYIYFGSNSGLSRFNKVSNKIEDVFINNKPIYSITSKADILYLSSDKEVLVYDTGNKQLLSLNKSYGSKDEYNLQSIVALPNAIILGSVDGLSILSFDTLNRVLDDEAAPGISLEELKIFNQTEVVGSSYLPLTLNHLRTLNLKYSDYPFTLTFSSPRSQDVSIFYQLDGLSENYVKAVDINAATYTNLSPGNYTLNVYAIDNLSKKQGQTKSININVTPPWWLSIQAKMVYLLIAFLFLSAIAKAIFRRREVQKKIVQSEERLKLSLWGSGDEMWDWDIESGQIYRSNIWGSLDFPKDGQRSGEPGEESNIHPLDQERVRDALNSHFKGETEHFEAAYRVRGKSGAWIWILDRAKIVERDEQDRAVRMTGTIKNISNFKQTEEQLKLFERAIRNMSEGMFILDDNFRFVAVNEACCQLSHRPREEFIGAELNFELYPENYSKQVKQLLNKHGRWHSDVEASRGDNSRFLMELTVDAIYGEAGVISHYVGVFSDITRRKNQEEELRKLTNNDVLTGLPNRSNMQVTLSNLVKKDSHHTLMVIDLDNFKKINDSLGHQVGDELLVLVARRLEQSIPRHTGLYRLGGDEFAILEDKLPDIGSGATIASRIIESFATPFDIGGEKLVIGLSIGIVLYPEDEQNEQALLRKADIAMYHAKSAGGNRYQFYSESLNKNAIRQLEIENLIREGLRKDYFQVHYQPKYDIKSNRLTGMEALVRLAHPEKGLISPGEFIPLAEENGLIVEIGDLVLKKACFAAQSWREQGLFSGRVAVNLSSHQFALPDLQQRIESILQLTRLPAANLELEITEGTVIKQPEKAIKVMQQLSKMGVSLALDDFGTGYSSLSYLKRFPINTLKIDKAFVDDIDKSDRDLKMVDSIITIAHNMGLSVVGEGVELAAQLSLLKALNCEEIQGFLYSKALPEHEFTLLLEQQAKVKQSAVS
ncbi:EAL domain-containing protein [Shewanella sp. GXUN23E]|uniref:EAL domain-containing protein n=1 Tax=Shewanella sp. GXUN23E TaxID=3422498 RepID=UPI003D7CF715